MNTQELFDLKGKTAIITGGGNGIGKAVCEIMSAHGANVVIADLKIEDAQTVSEQINENGGSSRRICKLVYPDVSFHDGHFVSSQAVPHPGCGKC